VFGAPFCAALKDTYACPQATPALQSRKRLKATRKNPQSSGVAKGHFGMGALLFVSFLSRKEK